MGLVVVLELVEPHELHGLGSGEELEDLSLVRLVHASASAPEVPGDPGPYTLCGLDTSAMLVEHWVRDRPGLRWYPPRWTGQICPTCEAAVRAG